jgi:tRNA (mo5U34)-methyltransferase
VDEREKNRSLTALRDEVAALAPWNLNVEITPGLSTRFFRGEPLITSPLPFGRPWGALVNARDHFLKVLRRIYPNGLEGRRVLDCGCNNGGYLFWAKELGAGECLGFDAREHWIKQARFLAENREADTSDVHFEVCDIYDLPKLALEPFDIVNFYGIFYHLPDPVHGLKIAADLAKELMIVDSPTARNLPAETLVAWENPEEQPVPPGSIYRTPVAIEIGERRKTGMGSFYDLHWLPSGPSTLTRILRWTGFPEARTRWRHLRGQPHSQDRVEILAAREEGFFDAFDQSAPRIREIVDPFIPAGSTVLVASAGNEDLVELGERCGWHFPRTADGAYDSEHSRDPAEAAAQIDTLREMGAGYLVFPDNELPWLDDGGFAAQLESRYEVLTRKDGVGVVFALNPA